MDMVSKQNKSLVEKNIIPVLVHMDMVSKQNNITLVYTRFQSFSSHGYGIKTKQSSIKSLV